MKNADLLILIMRSSKEHILWDNLHQITKIFLNESPTKPHQKKLLILNWNETREYFANTKSVLIEEFGRINKLAVTKVCTQYDITKIASYRNKLIKAFNEAVNFVHQKPVITERI